jgi:general stress protein 26
MSTVISESEKRDRLKKLIGHFDTAMLVTRTADGGMRARPLSIAESRADGGLYFSTAADSAKVAEIEANRQVAVTMQNGKRFVSITGTARVVDDRDLVEKLWTEAWRIWFPDGRSDPSLRIVIVEPIEATYWDVSGLTGLKYLFDAGKAYVSGTTPPSDGDQEHTAHVRL